MKFISGFFRQALLIVGIIVIAQNVRQVSTVSSVRGGNCKEDGNSVNGVVNIDVVAADCCNAANGENYCCNNSPGVPLCPQLVVNVTEIVLTIFLKLLTLVDFQNMLGGICNQHASWREDGKTCTQVAGNKGQATCLVNLEDISGIANCIKIADIDALTSLTAEQQNCLYKVFKTDNNKYNVNCCSVQNHSGNTARGGGGGTESKPTAIDCGKGAPCTSQNSASQNGTAQTQCCISSCKNEVKQSRSLPIMYAI